MAAVAAFGTTLTWNSQTVAKLSSISGVELAIDSIETSTHQSTSGFKEFLAGMRDGGEVTIEGFFDTADTNGQIAMFTDAAAGTQRTAVITGPSSGYTLTFTAFLTRIKIGDNAKDGAVGFSASLKITGVPVLGVSASNNVSALTVTTATLYPTFAAGTYDYVGTCAAASLTMTPTFAAGTCSIYNGTTTITTLTGVASSAIALGANGSQTTITMTIQETGKRPTVYTFKIARTA